MLSNVVNMFNVHVQIRLPLICHSLTSFDNVIFMVKLQLQSKMNLKDLCNERGRVNSSLLNQSILDSNAIGPFNKQ